MTFPIWQLPPLDGSSRAIGPEARGEARRRFYRQDKEKMLAVLEQLEPEMIRGKQGLNLSDERVAELFKILCQGGGVEVSRRRHNFLVDGLLAGRGALGWQLTIPAKIQALPREPSPFTPATFKNLAKLTRQYEKFILSIHDKDFYKLARSSVQRAGATDKAATCEQLQAGQLLFSAIVNGALWDKRLIEVLGSAISHDLVAESGQLWLELTHHDRDNDSVISRRWFPDPITGLLIIKWWRTKQPWPVNVSEKMSTSSLLKLYQRSLGVQNNDLFSMSQLCRAAKTRLGLRLPPFLMTYATKSRIAPSLPATAWARLRHNLVCQKSLSVSPQGNTRKIKGKRPQPIRTKNLPDQGQQYLRLYRAMGKTVNNREPGVQAVRQKINTILDSPEQLSPTLQALSAWSLNMLSKDRLGGRKVKRSTMETYMSTIGRPLVNYGSHFPSLALNVGDWMNMYDLIINGARQPQHQAYKAERLREFHTFVVHSYDGVADVDIADILSGDKGVNNNILTPKEYQRTRLELATVDNKVSSRIKVMQVLLLTLGFKCGLRRDEALGLLICDLQDGTGLAQGDEVPVSRPELLIRNNWYRTIKSKKSIRRLPLRELLNEQELLELQQLKQHRLAEITSGKERTELLFCLAGQGTMMLAAHESITPIQMVMRQTSGENSLVFHNLRHSFATFLILRLLEDDWPGLIPKAWGVTALSGGAAGMSFRQRLLRTDKKEASRRLLFVVSQFCGHVDPEETMSTYLHLLDYCQGHMLRTSDSTLNLTEQAAMLNLGMAGIKKHRQVHGLRGDTTYLDLFAIGVKRLEKKCADHTLKGMMKSDETLPQRSSSGQFLPPTLFVLYDIFRWFVEGTSISIVAKKYGYPEKKIQAWLARARSLASIKTGRGKSRLITTDIGHQSTLYLQGKPVLPKTCPARPHADVDSIDSLRIFNGVIALHDIDPELALNGLRIYLHHVTSSRDKSGLKILDNDDKKTFITFLRKSRIGLQRIRISLWPSDGKTILVQRRYWAKLLNLPLKQIHLQKSSYKMPSHAPFGRAMIVITTRDGPDKIIREPNSRSGPAVGLKFGLFMAAVRLAPYEPATFFNDKKQHLSPPAANVNLPEIQL